MHSFDDRISDNDESSSERMSFRTKPRIKRAIQEAAALSGMDDSTFTMNAAYRSALDTIEAHERTVLQPVDHAVFLALIDNPPSANAKLRAAFERHRKTVTSR